MTAQTKQSTDIDDDNTERFLSREEVCALSGLCYVTVWERIATVIFPPLALSAKTGSVG